ncbi:LuxR C-terminal-related transcriptional regulator [Paenibacillus caseinilyticus]|nr:helix-turn-helix transcriptional regulator [Paenibacillus mucilaginosus]
MTDRSGRTEGRTEVRMEGRTRPGTAFGLVPEERRRLEAAASRRIQDPDVTYLSARLEGAELRLRQARRRRLIRWLQQPSVLYRDGLTIVMAADTDGTLLHLESTAQVLTRLQRHNIGPGTRLTLEETGIHAVSAAVELGRSMFTRGREHTLCLFRDWSCFCMPVKDGYGETAGYLALTVPKHVSLSYLYPLTGGLVREAERELAGRRHVLTSIERQLAAFRLTGREMEIAKYWLLDYDYKQIGQALGISPNTVRVMIASIHGKLGVASKASMILKVLEIV